MRQNDYCQMSPLSLRRRRVLAGMAVFVRMVVVMIVVMTMTVVMPMVVMMMVVAMIVAVVVIMLVMMQALARARTARVFAEHQRLDRYRHGV